MNLQDKKQGFTIIEVVLVLAIAGLIFLMIFIALPALQRGQRDQGRRTDIGTIASAMNTYKANNNNSLTGLTAGVAQGYIDELSVYPKTGITVITTGVEVASSTEVVQIYTGQKCGTPAPASPGTPVLDPASRNIAVVGGLENNGSQVVAYCQDV